MTIKQNKKNSSCRYESTSSDDSSSESSDEASDSSEYHEAREKLPESSGQHRQTTGHSQAAAQPPESNTVPQHAAAAAATATTTTTTTPAVVLPDSASYQPAPADTKPPEKPPRSPAVSAIDTVASAPSEDPIAKEVSNTSMQEVTSASTGPAPQQSSAPKASQVAQQQYTVQSEPADLKPAATSSGGDTASKQTR